MQLSCRLLFAINQRQKTLIQPGDAILRTRRHRGVIAKVRNQRIKVNLTTQALGTLFQDNEVIATVSQETVHRDPVCGARIDETSIDHD